MTDGVPKQTGNSRYLKSAIDSDITFEQFRDMLRNGTLPIDLNGINPDGWAELGTPLNKASLLSDEPLKRLSLATSSVPTDMFNVLSKVGDLHVWRRTKSGVIDYPVSTNRNAYQECSDAKPAGYTLGAVQTGQYFFTRVSATLQQCTYAVARSVLVNDDGEVTLNSPTYVIADRGSENVSQLSTIKGKFIKLYRVDDGSSGNFNENTIYFIPSDAEIGAESTANVPYVTKRQTVTGYPAIPAGTTIEYLGNLGDKSRMQIVSYVGTGTYGESNPCSITADFPIKALYYLGCFNINNMSSANTSERIAGFMIADALATSFVNGTGLCLQVQGSSYGKKSNDGKTFYWYSAGYAYAQANNLDTKYYFLCLA